MKRNTVLEVLGFTALVCVIVVGVGMLANTVLGDKYDASETISLSTEQTYELKTYKLGKTKLDEFDNVSLQVDYADVEIVVGDDYYLEYCIQTRYGEPQYGVDEEGSFNFTQNKKKTPLMNFSFGKSTESVGDYVRLCIPEGKELHNLYVYTESGNIQLEDLVAGDVELGADYGNIQLGKITGDKLSMNLESGNAVMDDADVEECSIQNDYGNVTMSKLTCQNAYMNISSGNLDAKEINADQIDLVDEYGSIELEKLTCQDGTMKLESGNLTLGELTADNLDIQDAYGQIELALADKIAEYTCDFTTEYGSIRVPNQNAVEQDEDESRESYHTQGKSDKNLYIQNESGDIRVSELQ